MKLHNCHHTNLRHPDVAEEEVKIFDMASKTIFFSHIYSKRGSYDAHAYAFDDRYFAEQETNVAIANVPCSNPLVYLPKNHTSFDRIDLIPTYKKSSQFQVEAVALVECTSPIPTE